MRPPNFPSITAQGTTTVIHTYSNYNLWMTAAPDSNGYELSSGLKRSPFAVSFLPVLLTSRVANDIWHLFIKRRHWKNDTSIVSKDSFNRMFVICDSVMNCHPVFWISMASCIWIEEPKARCRPRRRGSRRAGRRWGWRPWSVSVKF